jgi:MFS family permease
MTIEPGVSDAGDSAPPQMPGPSAESGLGPNPVPDRRRRSGFWMVAYAYLIVMAVATLPSPLYGLYRIRDHLSAFMITVVFAIFAGGTIAALLGVRLLVARMGRRGVMLGSVATMMIAVGLLAAWKALPGLLVGRFLTGLAVGLASGTAITYLIELRLRADPNASAARAQVIGTCVTIGGLGIGPLIAGCLAQWAGQPLVVPYLVFAALGAVALAGLLAAPETGTPAARVPTAPGTTASASARSRRKARLPVPAAAGTLAAFAANGLFAGLSGLFLATTLHHPSHALAGATLFVVFACGVLSQLLTVGLAASRVLAVGMSSLLAGLALLVLSVRLPTPSLPLFLVGGALIGAGSGAVFKGTTGLVLAASPPESRIAMTSALVIALYAGLSVPVIGAGIALNAGVSPPSTVLGFAIVAGAGVALTGWALLTRRPGDAGRVS